MVAHLHRLEMAPREAPEAWRPVAERVLAEGVARHGELGIGLAELTAWVALVRAPGENGEGGAAPAPVFRLHPDLYLAAAMAKGIPEAWALWHDHLELPLVRWLTRLPGGVRLGEELVAELAGDLFSGKLREYRGDAALRTWLTVVARNRLTDTLRREGRRGVSLNLWESGEPPLPPDDASSDLAEEVTGRCDGERLAEALREELERLGAEEKRLLVRYFLEGTRMRVLAREYGINRTQVGRRLKAVCSRVRAGLAEHGWVASTFEGGALVVDIEVLRMLQVRDSEAAHDVGAPASRRARPLAEQAEGAEPEPLRQVAAGGR